MTSSPSEVATTRIVASLERSRRPAVTCSFQPGGLAVLHLMGDRRRDVPVLFIDTGYHFQETLEFKQQITELWGLDLRTVRTSLTAEAQQDYVGPLYRTNPDLCCEERKTRPLFAALEAHDLWITGLRRDQATSRRDTQIRERRILPSGSVLTKVNPIGDWTQAELEAYTAIHDIPVHPLMRNGYPSIGCAPCTDRAIDGSRVGRWGGEKIECGMHTGLAPLDAEA